MPGVQQQLFRLLSQDIGKASVLAGDYSADERLAAFLIDLSARTTDQDASPPILRLSMSRSDIANYLRLAAETVSRVLRRFQDQGLVDVDGRNVAIARPAELRNIARAMLRE
jgi:CRP/FNR family transcriptional regulator